MKQIGWIYLALSFCGIAYCLSSLVLMAYRSARQGVRRFRIYLMERREGHLW